MSGGFKHHQVVLLWDQGLTPQQRLGFYSPVHWNCCYSHHSSFPSLLNFEFCIYPNCWELWGMPSKGRGRVVWESGYPKLKYPSWEPQPGYPKLKYLPREQGQGTKTVLLVLHVRFPWCVCGFSWRNGRGAWNLPRSLCQ